MRRVGFGGGFGLIEFWVKWKGVWGCVWGGVFGLVI